jgi:hypothetical protein
VIQSHQDVNKAAVGQLQDKSVTGRAVTLSLRKTRPKRTRRFVGSQSLVDTLVIHTTHLIGVQNSVGTLVSREPGLIGDREAASRKCKQKIYQRTGGASAGARAILRE